MGLSYAPQYTWTEHFVQRAQERFEVNADSLPKWVGRQISSLTVYEPTIEQRPEEKSTFQIMELSLFVIQLNKNLLLVMKQMILLWKGRRLPFMNIMLTHSRKKLKIWQESIT